ncbi:class I SAM-dependent methyltransferase [Oscillatoria sp. FACHB-1406]|uniref:class I SAM-dependent methyltransferase n=1 Tax=Oscillatoria sp. FACHB-1406 TaxID=2692846 RepID=UPI0016833856|nr:class I SAM-dependent methyltransferase [Oscillatoria sp. FACHB-1406]MBD2578405.1 class I SAM-dependent methyltransferase [Oscillatoria sp. FACHB-1406]
MYPRKSERVRSFIRKITGCSSLEDLSAEERRSMWPGAKTLADEHICNCRLLENRYKMLEQMPKNGVCAEIGIMHCTFSEKILEVTQPKKLYLVDLDPDAIALAREKFAAEIESGQVEVYLGNSPEIIRSWEDNSLDWIYIDGDHSYGGAKRDLEASREKMKPEGLIALNDYIYFSTSDFGKYGVVEAVNEFCVQHGYELVYMALQERMYNDVVLRKIEVVQQNPSDRQIPANGAQQKSISLRAV